MNDGPALGTTLRRLAPLVRQEPGRAAAVVALGLLASATEGVGISLFAPLLVWAQGGTAAAGLPGPLRALAGLFAGLPPETRGAAIAGGLVALVGLRAALAYALLLVQSDLESRVGHRLRTGLFERFLRADYAWVERAEGGRLLNALATETWRTTQALGVLVGAAVTASTLVVYVALLLVVSWPLTLVVAAGMVVVAAVARRLTRRVQRLGRQATRVNAALAERVYEGLGSLRLVRLFGREADEAARFGRASDRVRRVFYRLGAVSGTVEPVYELLTAALLVGVFLGFAGRPGGLPLLVVFVFVLYRLQPRLKGLDGARVALHGLGSAVADVTALLGPDGAPRMRSGTAPVRALRDGVRFENVRFRYGAHGPWALDGVTFRVPAGQTVALVGPSGSGKTTLLSLLFRLYDPAEGRVVVDGVPLPDLDVAAWRERLALVSQDVQLFNTTVRANVAYGRPDAPRAAVEAAAKAADADGFIAALPEGYATKVGDGGTRLSGGQRQRLTLARALVRDPDVLVLDEATNALDSLSEHVVQEALRALKGTRTILVVAHRLSTIVHADHVVVLDGGHVVEQGTPAELLGRDGLFARLYRLQHAPLPG